ncbi:MAG: hypothetical protein EXR63_02830 [Dehalococcoidia bacterium]|nr:hypothetical protein [Dehalococcoidia bacterium]
MKQLRALALIALRGALAAAAIYYSYRYCAQFFQLWDTQRPLQWWAGRVTGIGAYIALSMFFGLMVSSRGLDGAIGRKTILEHHQQWALSAVVFSVAHVVVIASDGYVNIDVRGSLVPGQSAHLTGAVAVGTLALWGIGVLVVSSWLRAYMNYVAWRAIHATATGAFLLALAHGLVAGTDTKYELVRWVHLASGAAVSGATVFRLLYEARRARTDAAAARAPAAPRLTPPSR